MNRCLVTAGNGPAECRIAVAKILTLMETETHVIGASINITKSVEPDKNGPASAVVTFDDAEMASRWSGAIQWRCQSPLRPNHRRRNWFVGVIPLKQLPVAAIQLRPSDLKFESFRAGGPGGQHQNTTDSAVRVIHVPSGLTAVSRDQRSQHRNKAAAIAKLEGRMILQKVRDDAVVKSALHTLHKSLERGNPTRQFKGPKFREIPP